MIYIAPPIVGVLVGLLVICTSATVFDNRNGNLTTFQVKINLWW